MAKWLKLKQPSTSWNGPKVKTHLQKNTEFISSMETPAQMVANHIPEGTCHLVINCHGEAAPTLKIGTDITIDSLEAFRPIAGMPTLTMIWLMNCQVAYWPLGLDFCFQMARITRCLVVAHVTGVRNIKPPVNCIEDTGHNMRVCVDAYGDMIAPSDFYGRVATDEGFIPTG